MAEWPSFSKVFEAVPHCSRDSYGGLNILQDPSSENSFVRRLQPQERNSIKINNKPLDEIVIEE